MSVTDEMLSAYLDGELSEVDLRAVEAALEDQPELRDRLAALMAADAAAQESFAAIVAEPVPLALAAAIQNAPVADLASPAGHANLPNAPRRPAQLLAAAVAALALSVGSIGGYLTGREDGGARVAEARNWLDDIADYHAVYAAQVRHLVEVPADEADHIETWLTATLGVGVVIPDLAGDGLEFQGARLLVAAGRPVAQLIYTDTAGGVVALCQISTETPQDSFETRQINDFDLVSFGNAAANFVVVGDAGRGDLSAIAESAASQV
ncbi:MAG: anti-sigma factor [Pseudomonadota bacterium]